MEAVKERKDHVVTRAPECPVVEKAALKDYFVVSADCHVNEPVDVWSARVEKRFSHRLPHMKVDDKGRKWFVAEGIRPSMIREAPRDESVSVNKFIEQAANTGTRPPS